MELRRAPVRGTHEFAIDRFRSYQLSQRGSDNVRLVLGLPGLLILVAGFFAAGLAIRAAALGAAPPSDPLGRLWFDAHPSSLNALQVMLERHIWPPLWQDIVFPILQQPAPLVAAGGVLLGGLWLLFTRRRSRDGRRRLFGSR